MNIDPNQWPICIICSGNDENVIIIKYNVKDFPNLKPGKVLNFYFLTDDDTVDTSRRMERYLAYEVDNGFIKLRTHNLGYILRAMRIRLSID